MNWWWQVAIVVFGASAYLVEGLLMADALDFKSGKTERKLVVMVWPLVFIFLVIGFPVMFVYMLATMPKARRGL